MSEGLAASIRADLERAILSGAWKPGTRIPTEHALMQTYGCARMTVSKVLAGLASRGLITRRRRAGSLVAAPPSERAMLTIADFAAEAARSGRIYRHEIARLAQIRAEGGDFAPGEKLISVGCRHLFDATPIAWEDRLICIARIPAVSRARFRAMPPGPWLLRHVPWSEAEHEIFADTATASVAARLGMRRGAALLCLRRRTWHEGQIVTDATFAFPADRHRFSGRFSPG